MRGVSAASTQARRSIGSPLPVCSGPGRRWCAVGAVRAAREARAGSRRRPAFEQERAIGIAGERVTALVDAAVVVAAEQDEVVERVSPPSAQWRMWWASTNRRRSQPGNWQRPSRATSARRIDGGIERVLRPTLSGTPPRSTRVTMDASQPRRFAVSGAIPGPSSIAQTCERCPREGTPGSARRRSGPRAGASALPRKAA